MAHSVGRVDDNHHHPPLTRTDAILLAVAVAAVSTSAPLIREAEAPALAVAFWRNGLAAGVLVPAAVSSRPRNGDRLHGDQLYGDQLYGDRRSLLLAGLAGLLLGAHFAAWIPSLSFTTVSASVALVTTQPVWAALFGAARGQRLGRLGWVGIALAIGGATLITGVDITTSGRALFGDVLALLGGILAAAYISVGHVARRRLSTTLYTAVCYSVAAAGLLVVSLLAHQRLTGFSMFTWACIVAIAIGPQLLGHTVFNRVVRTVGPTVVSVAIVAEIVGAAILAAWWFGETPPPATIPAAGCIIAGVILVVRSSSEEVEVPAV